MVNHSKEGLRKLSLVIKSWKDRRRKKHPSELCKLILNLGLNSTKKSLGGVAFMLNLVRH